MAAYADQAGIRLIHLSTDYVFDGESKKNYAENDAVNPLSVYGRTKLNGETAVRNALGEHLIMRTSWVYSPFGRNFVKTMLALGATHKVLRVVEDQTGNPTSAHDIGNALLHVVEQWRGGKNAGVGETDHLSGAGSTSRAGFAREIFSAQGLADATQPNVTGIASSDWPTKARRSRNSRLDCSKFRQDFDFAMPGWQPSLNVVVKRLCSIQGNT